MPYISTEALVGAVLVIVLALSYQFLPQNRPRNERLARKRQKKKAKKGEAREDTALTPTPTPKAKPPVSPHPPLRPSSSSTQPPVEEDVDSESETEVPAPSFATVTASSSSTPRKQKTLAEKIAPKPRKTKVDDMIPPEDREPTHARVMRVVDSSTESQPMPVAESKVAKFSDDYESESEDDTSATGTIEDDGWNMVPSRTKKPMSISISSHDASTNSGGAEKLPVSTKIQRKNAKRAEAKKAAKALEEEDRLRRLAMHRKDLEREKINDLYSKKGKQGTKSGIGSGSAAGGKGISGATMDSKGKLVWD